MIWGCHYKELESFLMVTESLGTRQGKDLTGDKSHWPGQEQRQEEKWGHLNSRIHETQDHGDFKCQKPEEPVCCKSRWAAMWLFPQMLNFCSSLLPGKSFKSEHLPHPSTPENSPFPWAEVMKDDTAATVLICLRWKERKGNKAMQCSAWRKRNRGSFFRASSWLGSKYSHDKAIQFSNNSCTAKQLSALVSRGFCSGL